MFKIAQMVLLNDMRRARVMQLVAPRRYRVCVFGSGELLEVAAGDLALPGEDFSLERSEQSRDNWRNAGNLQVTNQQGGSYTKASGGGGGEESHELDGRGLS